MLAVEGLTKYYGNKTALQDINFAIDKGEVVALLGGNGSGKTTTVNAICNLIRYEKGSIHVNGINTLASSTYLKDIGAVLGGSRNINWRLTARQNAEYFARLRGARKADFKDNIASIEAQLELDKYHRDPVRKLSTGNKQKAALMAALCYSPQLLLLDEPTLGLDIETMQSLQTIIKGLAETKQHAFLITSHDMSFIDKIATRAVVIHEGKQVFDGTIRELKQKLFIYEMQIDMPSDTLPSLFDKLPELWQGKHVILNDESNIRIRYDLPEQGFSTLEYLAQRAPKLTDFTITKMSMEAAYLSLIEEVQS